MSNFFQLVRNEQVKLYARKSTWIMLAILVVIVLGIAILSKVGMSMVDEQASGDNWKQELQEQNTQLQEDLKDLPEGTPEMANSSIKQQIAENNYRLENNIPAQEYNGLMFVRDNKMLTVLVSLFTIIVAAGIVANEFKHGTIKLLLIRPVSRGKILFAKYASVLLFALTGLILLLVSSVIFGSIFFGWGGLGTSILETRNGEFTQISILSLIITEYSLGTVSLVMMATLAFMLSAVFRTSGLAIGVAIFLLMASNPIKLFLAQYDWSKFVLFANLDLNQYRTGTPIVDDMTLTFSVIVLLVYYFAFLFLSWLSFGKRDVAGQ